MTAPHSGPGRSRLRRPGLRGLAWLSVGLLITASLGREPAADAQVPRGDTLSRAPTGQRVRVRVLNGTSTRGLAKRATFFLRDLGYDVVDYDTDTRSKRRSTIILSHTGRDAWAQRLRRAVGVGAVEARADSSRYVDFTVILGSDWKAPAEAFRP